MEIDTPNPAAALGGDDDESDPITASYPVFTNPPPVTTRKLLILQYPNKQGPTRVPYTTLSEVRIKPGSGMIEVDVPLSHHDTTYDRDKGMKWGQALQRSMNQKNGGSHGLAGGFGVGVPAARAGRRREEDREVYDWTEAVRRDQVLRTQTLGGQYQGTNTEGDNECRWMVGVFKDGNLHLTPATSEIQLRPQLHHLDAATEQERLARPREGPSQGPGLGGIGKDGSTPGQPPAPKAIHMTIKSTSNNDQTTTETMADRLRHVQTESWQKLQYVGAEDQEAWDLYNKTLMYQPHVSQAAEARDAKGKGKARVEDPVDLKNSATRLKTHWAEEDFLHAVAGKDRDSILEGYGSTALPGIKPGDVVEDIKKEELDDTVRRIPAGSKVKGKAAANTKAAATPTTTRRAPAKGKGSAKGNAVEID